MQPDIKKYNLAQSAINKAICEKLAVIIDKELSKAESKIWHGAPVWFLEGNPITGYFVRKDSVQLLFWSGQSFVASGLIAEGSFKAAEMRYRDAKEIKVGVVKGWLKQAKKIQWDYKNIVKRKGKLEKIGQW
jgi:hypothetical protein